MEREEESEGAQLHGRRRCDFTLGVLLVSTISREGFIWFVSTHSHQNERAGGCNIKVARKRKRMTNIHTIQVRACTN